LVGVLDGILFMEFLLKILVREHVLLRVLMIWYSLVLFGKPQDLLVAVHSYLTFLLIVLVPDFIEYL
jgi:hypothetical protein